MPRFAFGLHRGAHGGACVHHLVVLAAAFRVRTPVRARVFLFETKIVPT